MSHKSTMCELHKLWVPWSKPISYNVRGLLEIIEASIIFGQKSEILIVDYLRPVYAGSRVLHPKSLEINPCNLSCWEHGSWDLPFHTGSHNLKSQLWHGCLHGNTFWRWGLGHVLRVGLSKKLDLTFHKSFINIFAWNNQDLPLMIINHVLMVFLGSNVGTFPPRWDLLTWVGLGTPCEPTSSYHKPPPLLINHKGLVTPPN